MHYEGEPLFVWRDAIKPKFEFRDLLYVTGTPKCKYCENYLTKGGQLTSGDHYRGTGISNVNCSICGWGMNWTYYDDDNETFYDLEKEKIILKIDDLNSDELCYSEIGKYLKSNYSNIKFLPPRKIELLIGDIFRNYGYKVIITKQTRDGGSDLILFDSNGVKSLVEIKKYNSNVGVQFVRNLLGVQLIRNVSYARLITTSKFSKEALKEAELNNLQENGFNIELNDATVLLELLNVYNGNNTIIEHQKVIERYI